jgi:site-specific recombinase XerC
MTFGLKNAGATYERAMNLIFHDIMIKLAAHKSHLANLRLAFERMRHYGLKMNPLKCAFGLSARKFLGFIIHDKGIEIDPKRIEKIKGVQAPTCKKDLQKFLGKVDYLRRFIANLSGNIIPFTLILKLKDESEFTRGHNNKRHLRK